MGMMGDGMYDDTNKREHRMDQTGGGIGVEAYAEISANVSWVHGC